MNAVTNILMPILKKANKQKANILLRFLPQGLKNDVTVSAAFRKHK